MNHNDPHLLIVDDDERIRDLLKKFLIRAGFLVTAARDAAHARRVLSGLDFDLIVLDVMMPGELDGLGLCRMIRDDESLKHIKIIMLSAKGQQKDVQMGLEAGADDYVVKPFSPSELMQKLDIKLDFDSRDRLSSNSY